MNYHEILNKVKADHPDLGHKEAQKIASEIFREMKEAEAITSAVHIPDASFRGIDEALSQRIESEIRGPSNTFDRNKILNVARSYGDFQLIEAGKEGVNTRVYLSGPTRVPAKGYFLVFIAR